MNSMHACCFCFCLKSYTKVTTMISLLIYVHTSMHLMRILGTLSCCVCKLPCYECGRERIYTHSIVSYVIHGYLSGLLNTINSDTWGTLTSWLCTGTDTLLNFFLYLISYSFSYSRQDALPCSRQLAGPSLSILPSPEHVQALLFCGIWLCVNIG